MDEPQLAWQRAVKLENAARDILNFVNLPYPATPPGRPAPGEAFSLTTSHDDASTGTDDLSSHKESSGADDEDQDRKQRFMAAKAGERESLRNQAVALVLYVSCCPCLTSSCVPGADVLHAALGAKEAAAALLKAYRQYTLAGCHQRGYPMSTHAAETPLFPCLLHIHVSNSSVFSSTQKTRARTFLHSKQVCRETHTHTQVTAVRRALHKVTATMHSSPN